MNELIKVEDRQIGDGQVQTINARELHAFLEVGKDFSNWIKAQIERARLVEGRDYCVFEVYAQKGENSKGGRPAMDCHLTLEAAKHVSMMSGTDKGFEVREYFIACEKRLKEQAPQFIIPQTYAQALLLAANQAAQIEQQSAIIEEQAPKVEFHDAVADASNCQTVFEVAKELGVGPQKLFRFLKEKAILMKDKLPYQTYIDSGYFRVILKHFDKRGETHTYHQTLVTGKGMAFIQKRLAKSGAPV